MFCAQDNACNQTYRSVSRVRTFNGHESLTGKLHERGQVIEFDGRFTDGHGRFTDGHERFTPGSRDCHGRFMAARHRGPSPRLEHCITAR